ncbi:MAG: TonB-dependent receptor [Tenuifilaceae bacterium]|jgi:hypothetical protein|nr:TonB-dependent receptor [Tenuifilaceae bacterium]
MRYIILSILLIYSLTCAGQMRTVSGKVTDAQSGEVLIGATLVHPLSGRGYTTNGYGFFSIKLPADSLVVQVNHMGYQPLSVILKPTGTPVSINLTPIATYLDEVVVTSSTNTRARSHGHFSISRMDLKNTPVLMAEKDVLKTIQLLPGVQQNSEGMSNFSVRGGNHDQNLMLIDGIPVYNINHLWGFVSVFNTEAVNNVNFFKGGIPASYGGRLSSVVDVMLREGNPDRYTGSVSVGLISSRFTVEGPIQKGKSSFLLAGRRTFYDLIVSPILYLAHGQMPGYYFQDYTLKLNHRVNQHNTIYLSSYMGNDKAYIMSGGRMDDTTRMSEKVDLGWANITTAFRWNNTSIPNFFSNVTVAYTHFKYLTSQKSTYKNTLTNYKEVDYLGYYSGINDLIAKWNMSYYGIKGLQINAGIDHSWHIFNPGITGTYYNSNKGDEGEYNIVKGSYIHGRELNGYIEAKFQVSRLSGNLGVRHSIFSVGDKNYHGLQPRGMLDLTLTEKVSVFAGYNRMFQHLHLVSNSNLGMPTDLWLPISEKIPPQQADQLSAGARVKLSRGMQVTLEAYTKHMQNLTEYRDGVVMRNQTTDWDRVLTLGEGNSKGLELMVEVNRGNLSGWITYSISKSSRVFREIRAGEPFPFQYDRRHSGNLFVSYKLSPTRSLSASWVASSGHWLTINHDNYTVNGQVVLNLSSRNNFQLPAYHHLDITYTSSKEKKRGTRSWVFGIYNVYARQNPFMVSRRSPQNGVFDPTKIYTLSLFPFVPFVAWEYVFK